MIHNRSDISSQEGHLCNTYQLDDQIIQPNDSELYLLAKKTAGLTNTAEKKVNHIVHITESGKKGQFDKRGLVDSLLIGAAVLTGVGILATGGYYYMEGRVSSGRTDNNLPSYPSYPSVPARANIITWETDSRSSTTSSDTLMTITSSPLIPETASSPYSYYEGIYGGATARNKSQPSFPVTMTEQPAPTTKAPVTTTEQPVPTTKAPVTTTEHPVPTTKTPVTTTEQSVTTTQAPAITTALIKKPVTVTIDSFTSAYMTEKPTTIILSHDGDETAVTEYKHDSGRSIYYQTIKGEYNYPLGKKFFNELLDFCLAETKYNIEQAYRGTPELRCTLLDDINNKIAALKEYETLVRRINADKETLSIKEHAEEIMLRRKLVTLYLAAEYIINKKDFDVFLHEVNRDYKKHSTKELEQREEKIMNYFPDEC